MVTQLPVKELVVGSNPTRGARIKLASESRKLARAARSAAQGGEAVSRTSLFCKCRFKNSKAEDFWREDFLEGNANAVVCLPHPPVRAPTSSLKRANQRSSPRMYYFPAFLSHHKSVSFSPVTLARIILNS